MRWAVETWKRDPATETWELHPGGLTLHDTRTEAMEQAQVISLDETLAVIVYPEQLDTDAMPKPKAGEVVVATASGIS